MQLFSQIHNIFPEKRNKILEIRGWIEVRILRLLQRISSAKSEIVISLLDF